MYSMYMYIYMSPHVRSALTVHVAAGGGVEVLGVEVLVRLEAHQLRGVVAKDPTNPRIRQEITTIPKRLLKITAISKRLLEITTKSDETPVGRDSVYYYIILY